MYDNLILSVSSIFILATIILWELSGPDEFILILPDSGLDTALKRAEKIREGMKLISLVKGDKSISGITFSIGVSVFPEHGDTQASVIESADAALYRAKTEGRDRICIASRSFPMKKCQSFHFGHT